MNQLLRFAAYRAVALHSGKESITSAQIGALVGAHPTQVRRDISEVLGSIGGRGVGYDVETLIYELDGYLGPHRQEILSLALMERALAVRTLRSEFTATEIHSGVVNA